MIKPERLLFGTAGIPELAAKAGTVEGIAAAKKLGLGCMELEFVHSINISREKAPLVNEARNENDIVLTCHAPYYINLNAKEKPKWHASITRITNSVEITSLCGGYSTCFHPGYRMGDNDEVVYAKIKEAIKAILDELDKKGIKDVWVRPETAGRIAQFGTLAETFEICSEFDNVLPCIDWSHIHATSNGKYNTTKEFEDVLNMMEKKLGKRALQNVHFHCQGVAYSEKGEKNHIMLEDSDLNFKDLVRVWKDYKLKGAVIAESPRPQADALLLKKTFENA